MLHSHQRMLSNVIKILKENKFLLCDNEVAVDLRVLCVIEAVLGNEAGVY